MKFKIPFTFSNIERLKNRSGLFISRIKYRRKTKLGDYLKFTNVDLTREEYLGICVRIFFINFVFLLLLSTTILFIFDIDLFFLYGFAITFMISFFIFFSQLYYPKTYLNRKQVKIEKNLLPALSDMLIQLNSGIPLFNIMVNISGGDYDVLSGEFKEAVKRINAGEPESKVLDEIGKKNPSKFFRRTLWQISNGMIAGSDMTVVIKDSIDNLNDEQLIQIQNYGNRLNPLVVLYMLLSVIIPALSITFLTIIASMIGLPEGFTILLFISLFVFDVLAQIMFIGLIRSRKPSLL